MTVLGRTAHPESEYFQQGHLFAAHRRYDGSRPVRGRAIKLSALFSRDVCRNALRLAVLLSMILLVVVLFLDLGSLCASGANINQLSARIRSLNSDKAQLQEDLAMAMNHPILRTADTEEEDETVITLTAILPDLTKTVEQ